MATSATCAAPARRTLARGAQRRAAAREAVATGELGEGGLVRCGWLADGRLLPRISLESRSALVAVVHTLVIAGCDNVPPGSCFCCCWRITQLVLQLSRDRIGFLPLPVLPLIWGSACAYGWLLVARAPPRNGERREMEQPAPASTPGGFRFRPGCHCPVDPIRSRA